MMLVDFPLFPEQASTFAGHVDALYIFLVLLTGGVSLLIWITIFFFAIKYRRRPDNELAQEQEPPHLLETAWIVIPTILFLAMFVWGAWLYFRIQRVPDNAIEVYATGRQWMWSSSTRPASARSTHSTSRSDAPSRSRWHPRT
jgi:cytochrome c oxidase subunit 2